MRRTSGRRRRLSFKKQVRHYCLNNKDTATAESEGGSFEQREYFVGSLSKRPASDHEDGTMEVARVS